MLHVSARRVWAFAVSAALLGAGSAAAGLPAAAAAKAKPLTKAQVIALIRQYSKPGPQGARGLVGPKGDQGPQGNPGPSWSVPANSGLTLSGDALGLNFGSFASCPGYEYMFRVGHVGDGTVDCKYEPTSDMWEDAEGYQSGSAGPLNPPLGVPIGNPTPTEIVVAPANGVAGPHLVTASIQLGSTVSGGTTDSCELDHTSGSNVTPIQTESTTVNAYNTLYFQAVVDLQVNDFMSVNCVVNTAPGMTGDAGGNILEYLANN